MRFKSVVLASCVLAGLVVPTIAKAQSASKSAMSKSNAMAAPSKAMADSQPTAMPKHDSSMSKPSNSMSKPSTSMSKPTNSMSKPSTSMSKPTNSMSKPSKSVTPMQGRKADDFNEEEPDVRRGGFAHGQADDEGRYRRQDEEAESLSRMFMRRREFVAAASGFVASGRLGRGVALHPSARIRAVAFDGFAIFDATAILPVAEALAPGKGRELVTAWRSRHFEYQWLRTLGGQYADFQRTADDALVFAANALGLELTATDRARLVSAQAELRPWNDTSAAVRELRAAGLRLALLSNMTEPMLVDGLRRAGLADSFEFVLSTDRVRVEAGARSLRDGSVSVRGFA